MKFSWVELSKLIKMLSDIAIQWWKLVGQDNPADTDRAKKAAAVVLDPDRPEENPEEVDVDGR